MKKLVLSFIFLTSIFHLHAQDKQLRAILDSINAEADIMYKYEKAVWKSTDLLLADPRMQTEFGGYVVMHNLDTVFVTYLNKAGNGIIARYYYSHLNFSKPLKIDLDRKGENGSLKDWEKEFYDIKVKILGQLSDEQYKITMYEDFNPNLVLLKGEKEFRMYIIMGTSKPNIIPLGNDYLFRSDMSGKITSWKKFHSRLIPFESKGPDGQVILSAIHTHLEQTPYISATDICTFRLYGELCKINTMMVLCTATNKYYSYNLDTNIISVTDK